MEVLSKGEPSEGDDFRGSWSRAVVASPIE